MLVYSRSNDIRQGAVKERFEALRNGIVKVLASVEALIDFGEGEEIEEGVFAKGEHYFPMSSWKVRD